MNWLKSGKFFVTGGGLRLYRVYIDSSTQSIPIYFTGDHQLMAD